MSALKKCSRPKTPSTATRPILQPGEHLDIAATSTIIQEQALKLFRLLRAGKISEREALCRNKELRSVSKVIDKELRRERHNIKAARALIGFFRQHR